MKHIDQKLWMVIAMLCLSIYTSAYDFEVDGIYYTITSMADLEVSVTYKEQNKHEFGNFSSWPSNTNDIYSQNDSYNGDVVIPPTVNYNNKTFTVTTIGNSAFGSDDSHFYGYTYNLQHGGTSRLNNYGCKITNITLPETIRKIEEKAFKNCLSLRSINLPSSLEEIGDCAFMSCESVTSIILPNGLKTIGDKSFQFSGLNSLQIPNEVNKIGNEAFNNCLMLNQTVLGSNIQQIGSGCFSSCKNLIEVFCTSVFKPNGLNPETFLGSHSALEIYVPSYEAYGLGREYLTFPKSQFGYTGQSHNIEWANNLKAYKCEIGESECQTEVNAGQYTKYLTATYSNGVDFLVEIPYDYVINKAPMTLSVNNIQREYGDPNPAFTCDIVGFVNGENEQTLGSTPSYECEATQISKVGDYRILASLDAPNYEITYKYGTLSVIKAPLEATVLNTTKIYGNENPDFSLSFSGLKNNETAPEWSEKPKFSTPASITSVVGEYEVNASDGITVNYELTKYNPGKLTINKRDLTAKANDCERLYDEENPLFEISYIGFVNDDSETSFIQTPIAECNATKTSNAGTYPITVTGGKAENYNFVYQDGSLKINPLTVGFKEVYNSVMYNDMALSTSDSYFYYIPEIVGPFSEDDFWVELWFLDKDNTFDQHVTTISSGDYAGNYVNTNIDRPMWVGKYIFNLTSKGTNPNVTANPSRAYLTVNRTSNNLEWMADSPIRVKVGEKVDLGITYQADLWCTFNTDYNEELIELSSEGANGNTPHWFATGLKEGETSLYFGIECRKNDMGFYDFTDSRTLSKRIIVEPSAGINTVTSDDSSVYVTVRGRNIHVFNKCYNELLKVYTIQGSLIYDTTEDEVHNLEKGLYILNIGSKSFKIKI
ncbi:MAG: leucine-rich repeat protein [Duncaniella sp.]|nr:leucine-rich repeat protein [Duncaniella sp.]